MSVTLNWVGLDEFKAALRQLPQHLADEARSIVTDRALTAGVDIEGVYRQHDVTGNLSSHVKVESAVNTGNFGVNAKVKSTARHAWWFDNGTQARHYTTKACHDHRTGKMWGRSAPTHAFVRTMIRQRRLMQEDLIGLVQREGFTVSGNAG